MNELLFSWIDLGMFTASGMALGFVIGASLMERLHKAATPDPELELRRLLHLVGMKGDDGESFHEGRGDV